MYVLAAHQTVRHCSMKIQSRELIQFNPGNRAKSVSVVRNANPRLTATAANLSSLHCHRRAESIGINSGTSARIADVLAVLNQSLQLIQINLIPGTGHGTHFILVFVLQITFAYFAHDVPPIKQVIYNTRLEPSSRQYFMNNNFMIDIDAYV
jgi:hypothetical protein